MSLQLVPSRRFEKLAEDGDSYYITRKKRFRPIYAIGYNFVDNVIDHGYRMSFGGEGDHRRRRSGGKKVRGVGQVFSDAFQGKICEYGLYQWFKENKIKVKEPDVSVSPLGIWDTYDFAVNNHKLNVKSTRFFGNLLLLETKDWNNKGEYIPNIEKEECNYDFFLFTRVKPNPESIMKKNRLLYSNAASKKKIAALFRDEEWLFDFPGYVTRQELMYIIKNGYILPQGRLLNGKVKMDAENYYIQAGCLREPRTIIQELK